MPPPSSPGEAGRIHEDSKLCVPRAESITVPWIDGEKTLSGSTITLSHDIGRVLREHGDGVYTLLVWGCSVADSVGNPCEDDNSMVILQESIFYGIDAPDTYSPDAVDATPTPTPTAAPAPTATPTAATQRVDCGNAVTDKSNTGLVADCNALLTAKDTLRSTAALNWAPDTPIAQWEGIRFGGDPKRVTIARLQKKGLTGQIPAALGRLDMLEELWLYTNQLSGTIPPEIGNLTNLRWLFVSSNSLEGQIPETLNNLSLDRLWLHKNNFTGCVPYNLTLTREYKVDSGLPACAPPGSATPTPAPPSGTPTPAPPGTTPTPVPTAGPGNTDDRLSAIEGRLDDVETRVASLETTVAGLTGSTPTPTR